MTKVQTQVFQLSIVFSKKSIQYDMAFHCQDRCLSFCTFSFGIVFSVLLRFTDSDYPFGIFKLFLFTREVAVIESTMAKRKRTKEQTAIYKTLHRKLKIKQNELH
jgi:hypothetical protein